MKNSTFFNFYFGTKGRITSWEFWTFYVMPLAVINILLGLVSPTSMTLYYQYSLGILGYKTGTMTVAFDTIISSQPWQLILLGLMTWVDYCAGIKRLHDSGRSGFYLLFLIIPVIGLIIMIILFSRPSDTVSNKWGHIVGGYKLG